MNYLILKKLKAWLQYEFNHTTTDILYIFKKNNIVWLRKEGG
jgi:hypothetical protein